MIGLLLGVNFFMLFCLYMKIEKLEIKMNKYSKESLKHLETVGFNIIEVYSILCDINYDKKMNNYVMEMINKEIKRN